MGEFSAEARAKSIATRRHRAEERRDSIGVWFWDHATKSDGCWLWNGDKTAAGYGKLYLLGKMFYAHRVAWELTNGAMPKGLFVCHTCDTPSCVRPDHLFVGTNADNLHDMISKGRQREPIRPTGDDHWTHKHPERVRVGERNNMAKLTAQQVLDIRCRYPHETQTALAKQYGVRQSSIWQVLSGRTWKHITGGVSCL